MKNIKNLLLTTLVALTFASQVDAMERPFSKEEQGETNQVFDTDISMADATQESINIGAFNCLPDEIILKTLSFLTQQNLARVFATCHQMKAICLSQYLINIRQQLPNMDELTIQELETTLYLLKCLIQQGEAFPQATHVAKNSFNIKFKKVSDCLDFCYAEKIPCLLFEALFKQGQAFPEALQTAIENYLSSFIPEWLLLNTIIKNIQYCSDETLRQNIFAHTIEAAKYYLTIRGSKPDNLRNASTLLCLLFTNLDLFRNEELKQNIFALSFNAAKANINDSITSPSTLCIKECCLKLFLALIQNIQHCTDEPLKRDIKKQAFQAAKSIKNQPCKKFYEHYDASIYGEEIKNLISTLYLATKDFPENHTC